MKKTPVPVTGIVFFWAGFVCSISFMEAWLKFKAPGVTLETGLSIGKLIFSALNRVEWVFVFLLTIGIMPRIRDHRKKSLYLTGTLILILIIQTFFLLPELNERADLIIAGNEPGGSPVHLLFGIAEVTKIILLLWLGVHSLKLQVSNYGKKHTNNNVEH